MPLTLQGTWTISVKIKNPSALPQRFIVSNAQNGNGTYAGFVGASPVTVSGNNWQLNIQANESYEENGLWINSSMRSTPQVQLINGQLRFDVESEDLIQDNTWDDLVLTLISPVPPSPPVVPPPVVPPPPPPVVPPPVVPPPPPPVVPPPPVELGVGKVYTKIEDGDRLPRQTIATTYGIWLDYTGSQTGNLTTFFTCSSDTGSFKKSVYQSQCFTCSSKPQFDIAYGHDGGSGSRDLGGSDWFSPSNAIYGQYRSLCLGNRSRFKMGHKEIHHFYVINVKRDRMGDRLDEGNIELNIAELSGSLFQAGNPNRNAHTGSNVKLSGTGKIVRLVDDSRLDLNTLSSAAYSGFYQPISESKAFQYTDGGEMYYMVSGSVEEGIYSSTQPHVYGMLYPRLGVILLDADILDTSASFLTVTGSDVSGDNAMKLFTAVSGAALYTDASGDYLGLSARKTKYSYVERYFVRIKNSEYNFTNNPSYVTGSEGDIITDFYGNPQVYITSIGLYNDNHDLLAVGKLSVPIYKSYTEEALLTLSISYE